ncbi:MAG: lysophospholipase [Acidimicrobiales bacterium]|nr:lysophospholipase [Acidimicrobiales bacterium]
MRRTTVVLATIALAVAGCSGGGGTKADPTTATSTTAATSTTNAVPGSSTTTAASGPSTTTAGSSPSYVSKQYDGTTHWICHPDLPKDECGPQAETSLEANGAVGVPPAPSAEHPKIDCFYVYPTISTDTGVNSDLSPDASELAAVRVQVARYSSVCRVFAPVYRQITLVGLGGKATPANRALAYGDVLDAWRTYLAQQNHGRGVVLIGHSQGSGHLVKLMSEEIDPRPAVRKLLVSAIIMGGRVDVPAGKDVGGSFQHIPACRQAGQTGCVISFSSFPAAQPPGADAVFGRDPGPGQRALCVDPVALAGGNGLADAVVPRQSPLLGSIAGLPAGSAPFVSLPAALKARCAYVNGHTVLLFDLAHPGADKRSLAGLLKETLAPTWGLHLLDANLAQDDLISIVRGQANAWPGAN